MAVDRRFALFAAGVLAGLVVGGLLVSDLTACSPSPCERTSERRAREPVQPSAARSARERRIRWRRSQSLGTPTAGRLVNGVQLPASGRDFTTWDPVLRRSPNRGWRRWGTDRLVLVLLHVAREHSRAHREAPPLLIGDLSRPHGGDFGPHFGYIGHASHQNGLDADIYYPRSDRARRAPRTAVQIDRRLSQELVDRLTRAGAARVFVGPGTGLTGPPGVVQVVANHDNHLHVRIALTESSPPESAAERKLPSSRRTELRPLGLVHRTRHPGRNSVAMTRTRPVLMDSSRGVRDDVCVNGWIARDRLSRGTS